MMRMSFAILEPLADDGDRVEGIKMNRIKEGMTYSITEQSRIVSPPPTPFLLGSFSSSSFTFSGFGLSPGCIGCIVFVSVLDTEAGMGPGRTGADSAYKIDWIDLEGEGVNIRRRGKKSMYLILLACMRTKQGEREVRRVIIKKKGDGGNDQARR